jgi:death-on-curing protein
VSEPVWLAAREAVAINHRLVALFGGLAGGARDENLLQAAITRPLNKWHYDPVRPDLFTLAAAYSFAIVRGHAFLDGNKRTAHALAAVFLANNGIEHVPSEQEIVAVMVALAEGRLSEDEFAAWLRQTSKPHGEAT